MGYISDDVRGAAGRMGVTAQRLTTEATGAIIGRLKDNLDLDPGYFSVAHDVECEAIHNEDSWPWIEEFVGDRPAILLFPPSDEVEGWRFANGHELISVLGACFHAYEYFVTSPEADYAIAFDHHGILIAVGPAAAWLRARLSESSDAS